MIRYIFAGLLLAAPALAQTGNLSGGSVTPTGATGSRTLASTAADVVNVKNGWAGVAGAKGDVVGVSGCTIAAAGTLLTCSSATFTSADTGKRYYLQGTGAANVPQTGTITYVSATTVTLSNAAVVASPQSGIYSAPASPVTIANAGTGYTTGTQSITITGGTCTTQPVVSATVAAGSVTEVLGMVTPGVCSVAPSSAAATTGGGGTGATFNTSGYPVAGRFIYGSDDTAAITAAAARAVSTGRKLLLPSGGYWLATASTAIPLNNVAVEGDGAVGYNWPYIGKGSWLLLSNQSTASFSGMQGVDWNGVSIYYPEQDSSAATPVAFPATFTGSQWVNTTFRNSRFINTRIFGEVTNVSGSGLGRVTMDNVKAYCVLYCWHFLNGAADVLVIGPNNYFGPGSFDNDAIYGPANLGRYTATSGEFLRIDVGAGAYPRVDGLMFTGFIVHGYRYGIRLVSGAVYVSAIGNMNWDAVQTAYSMEGTSIWTTNGIIGGTYYGTNIYDATATGAIFTTPTSGRVDLSISGGHVSYAMGGVFLDAGAGNRRTVISGMSLNSWARTSTAGTYYALQTGAGGPGTDLNLSGNTLNCDDVAATTSSGILITANSAFNGTISGSMLSGCANGFVIQGGAGAITLASNVTKGTTGSNVLDNSTLSLLLYLQGNTFDAAAVTLRAPAISSCGTTPSAAAGSNNQGGTITIGTGVVTACTLTFTSTLVRTPRCTAGTNSASIVANATSVSTTAVAFGFSADLGGGLLRYRCEL
jgi:hypothetical protein